MADFLKMSQFMSPASLKNNIHHSTADSDLWKQAFFHSYNDLIHLAYIYIIPSIVTCSNSYRPFNREAYNSLLCLLQVFFSSNTTQEISLPSQF